LQYSSGAWLLLRQPSRFSQIQFKKHLGDYLIGYMPAYTAPTFQVRLSSFALRNASEQPYGPKTEQVLGLIECLRCGEAEGR